MSNDGIDLCRRKNHRRKGRVEATRRVERQQRADGESKVKIQKRWRLVQGVVLLLQNMPRYSFDISMWVPISHIGDKWAGTPEVDMGPAKNATCELLGHWYGHYGLLVYNKNHKN